MILRQYKHSWDKSNAVVLDNLLTEEAANEMWEYYNNQPNDYWDLAIYPDNKKDYGEDGYPLFRCKSDDESIEERIKYTRECNNNGIFSYLYKRTEDFHPNLSIFETPEFISAIEFITGIQNLEFDWKNTFITCYEEGHFNGPHTDGTNGRLAFVFHLSKDWKVWDGGLFIRMDNDWKTADKIIVPDFNKLAMFNVFGDGYGAPHLVSEVALGCNKKRISFTGWYK